MSGPTVSIVVPLYQGERFIEATLASLLAQDYPHVEVVVVDDGSTDSGPQLVAGHDEVVLVRQPNQGVATARNAGVARARGELIAFCDQDDRHVPHKTSRQVAHLEAHPETAYVMARQQIVLDPGVDKPEWLGRDPIWGDLGGILPLSGLARRELFDEVGGFDQTIATSDDFDWLVRVRAAGRRIDTLDEVLVLRGIHDSNRSHEGQLEAGTLKTVHKLLQAKRRAGGAS